MVQLVIFLVCHPCWEIRRRAYDATKKIIASAPQLTETLLLELTSYLSLAAEKLYVSNTRYILVLSRVSFASPVSFSFSLSFYRIL